MPLIGITRRHHLPERPTSTTRPPCPNRRYRPRFPSPSVESKLTHAITSSLRRSQKRATDRSKPAENCPPCSPGVSLRYAHPPSATKAAQPIGANLPKTAPLAPRESAHATRILPLPPKPRN